MVNVKLYIAIASAIKTNEAKYYFYDGASGVCRRFDNAALFKSVRNKADLTNESYTFKLNLKETDLEDLKELFYMFRHIPFEEWDDESKENLGLRQCYYTDIWEFEDDMVYVENNGEYACWIAEKRGFIAECYECGDYYDIDEMTYADGEWVCNDCLYENYFQCEHCGEWGKCNINYLENYDYYVCDNCLREEYTLCEYCGEEYILNNDIHTVVDCNGSETYYCDCCWEYHAYYCEECCCYVTEENYNFEEECCCDCSGRNHGRKILEYQHTTNNLTFYHKDDDFEAGESQWHIGIELEVTTSRDNAYKCENEVVEEIFNAVVDDERLVLKRDCSINRNGNYGFEIVTMPFSYKEWQRQRNNFNDILQICRDNNYTSHDNGLCGLHIHVSRSLFGNTLNEVSDNVSKLIKFYETYYGDIVKVSRRTLEQCNEWAAKYSECEINKGVGETFKEKCSDIVKYKKCDNRYKAVNIQPKNTIEFRIMRGTLNENSFWACFDFTLTLAMNCKNISWDNIDNVDMWLNGMEENTIKYLKKRGAFTKASLLQ